jgi:hypothetical protein
MIDLNSGQPKMGPLENTLRVVDGENGTAERSSVHGQPNFEEEENFHTDITCRAAQDNTGALN